MSDPVEKSTIFAKTLGTCENLDHDSKPQEWHEENATCIDWSPGELRRGDSVRKDGGRWGVRTIKNGTIRWCHDTYKVAPIQRDFPDRGPEWQSEPEYDGRLDGLRALFYTYRTGIHEGKVFLHSFGGDWPGPNCIDGYFHWERWEKVA